MMEDNQYIIEKELEHQEFEKFWNRFTGWVVEVFVVSIAFLGLVILWRLIS